MRLFVFGLGYSAQALARLVLDAGGTVAGTVRTAPGVPVRGGVAAELFATDRPLADPRQAFAGVTHLLSSIPPDADGDPAWRAHAREIAAARGTLQWIGYLSTTGVYGDRGGNWVDEATLPAPGSARSRQRLAAEAQWLLLGREIDVPAHVFRLPGIYGPGRSALDQVRSGNTRRIDKPGQYFSRIHVEDIAATVLASIQRPRAGAIYNVADDEPAPNAEVIAEACRLLDVPIPAAVPYEVAAPAMSEMARSFWQENRRVRNERIKRELAVVLRYPTYREGLRGILAAERR